ncbi:MAG: FHA domain-containing protein [Bacteroidaceae bacterium]|nr:FHA domain-containing protein [Bacteroidaceae bacterium]
MKKVRCPKCGNTITFDETAYPEGRVLIFGCPDCKKTFKIKLLPKADDDRVPLGFLSVVENQFHNRQTIPLYMGENVVGRYVKGSQANASFRTLDPSIDTTHCIITVQEDKRGRLRFILRDAPSNTGTFYQNEILKDVDRVYMEEQSVLTIGATTLIFYLNPEQKEVAP